MNGISLLADTNILIYLLNGNKRLIQSLENKLLYLSFISEIELLSSKNLTISERELITKLLNQSNIIDINSDIKKETIYLRSKYSLKLPDAIIAATSIYLNIPIFTSDKDFRKIIELNVIYFEI